MYEIFDDLLFNSEEISDEMAYYLVPFFYRLAYWFEKRHLTQAQRYQKEHAHEPFCLQKPWEEKE